MGPEHAGGTQAGKWLAPELGHLAHRAVHRAPLCRVEADQITQYLRWQRSGQAANEFCVASGWELRYQLLYERPEDHLADPPQRPATQDGTDAAPEYVPARLPLTPVDSSQDPPVTSHDRIHSAPTALPHS